MLFFPQHCSLCRPLDSTVSEDVAIEPRNVRYSHVSGANLLAGLCTYVSLSTALQQKSYLCIPFLGILRPQSQFPHSCVCERFMYSQDRSTYLAVAK
jgi:hypothetical protein